jgi:hypothetical protein
VRRRTKEPAPTQPSNQTRPPAQGPAHWPGCSSLKRSRASRTGLLAMPMITALRTHWPAFVLVLNALVVGLVVGGVLCATLICR